jgi:hypothetical protein
MNIRKLFLNCVVSILSFFRTSGVVDAIDRGVASLDLTATPPPAPAGLQDAIAHVIAVFGGVRALLATLAAILPMSKSWRAGLDALVASLDALTMNANASFKAGKDV